MTTYSMVENVVLILILAACVLFVVRRFAPGLWGTLLRRPVPVKTREGCGSGCSTCGSCGSASQDKPLVHISKRS